MKLNRMIKWAAAGVLAVASVPAVALARHASLPTENAISVTPVSLASAVGTTQAKAKPASKKKSSSHKAKSVRHASKRHKTRRAAAHRSGHRSASHRKVSRTHKHAGAAHAKSA